jgi:REP element-mobilizing transposase RayT
MPKRDHIDFQDRNAPLAYLITFRSYGTWLHGEDRGSVDRRHYNRYGTPDMPANKRILAEQVALKSPPLFLDRARRAIVVSAIREVCQHRNYLLHAVNVRTNHVHSVVFGKCKPEHIMNAFKAYATRKLRETSLLGDATRPWSRHGSTPYLWTEEELERAIDYVINGQSDEPFR